MVTSNGMTKKIGVNLLLFLSRFVLGLFSFKARVSPRFCFV